MRTKTPHKFWNSRRTEERGAIINLSRPSTSRGRWAISPPTTNMAKRKQDELSEPSSRQPGPRPTALAVESAGPREVLSDFNSLDKLVGLLRTCKRVVVVTGAGIR